MRAVVSCGCALCVPFSWLPVLAPPCRARGAVHAGGGLHGAPCGALRLVVSSECPFRLKMAASPWVVAKMSRVRSDEARVNLVTPLCRHPLSVADVAARQSQAGESASGEPCHYLPCSSDRAASPAAPWWLGNSCKAIGRVSLPNPPCGRLGQSHPTTNGGCHPHAPRTRA
jgi:hypothetical protein